MRWSSIILRAVNFHVSVRGQPPKSGFIVSNHLSYMDIPVMGSIFLQAFMSKSEVKDWPLIGSLTRGAGTLYIDRNNPRDVARHDDGFSAVMASGLMMTIFLEGTSSDGSDVLPFRSSLLAPVVKNQWPVTPAYLEYECDGGDAATDVCYWGDMVFGSHLLNLIRIDEIRVTVVFGKQRQPGEDRKALASELREEVLDLRHELRSESGRSGSRSADAGMASP